MKKTLEIPIPPGLNLNDIFNINIHGEYAKFLPKLDAADPYIQFVKIDFRDVEIITDELGEI